MFLIWWRSSGDARGKIGGGGRMVKGEGAGGKEAEKGNEGKRGDFEGG